MFGPQHPDRLEIVPALLDVFVNIEATGQAVEFEQKFSYRRPMYDVMRYLWELEDFQEKFASLVGCVFSDVYAYKSDLNYLN